MRSSGNPRFRLLLPLIGIVVGFQAPAAVPIAAFRPAPIPSVQSLAPVPGILRQEQVELTAEFTFAASEGRLTDGATFTLPTLDGDATMRVSSETIQRGGRLIRGRSTDGRTTFQMSVHGAAAAVILKFSDGARQLIEPRAGGHLLYEPDPGFAVGCGVDGRQVRSSTAGDAPLPQLNLKPPDELVYIADVLVVYTEQALQGAGGLDGMMALLDLAEIQANEVLADSKAALRLRVVHHEQIAYAETGDLNQALSRLRDNSDGYMDSVHSLRNQKKADLVALLVETSASNVAGIAYVMSPVSRFFNVDAFSVSQRRYVLSNYVLIHELGHNFGCQHDRENSSTGGAYAYSYGHRFTTATGVKHTVMAYQPGTLIPFFSNPDVLFEGQPTGIPAGSTGQADNALTINNAAATLAAFRSPTTSSFLPVAEITFPTNHSTFYEGVTLTIHVEAATADGTPARVELETPLLGSLGVRTNAPYTFTMTNVPISSYTLKATVTDPLNLKSTAPEVTFVIQGSPPRLDAAMSRPQPDDSFLLRIMGYAGQQFQVDRSTNLVNWLPLTTNTLSGSFFDFLDAPAGGTSRRFYRLIPRH